MAKWETLTPEEEQIARAAGLDPDKDSFMVDRVGSDQLVLLRHRDREEFHIPIYKNPKQYIGRSTKK